MEWVRSVTYQDSNESAGAELDDGDTVDVTFSCPICSSEEQATLIYPPFDYLHTCSSCRNQYTMYPVVSYPFTFTSFSERIEAQLQSVMVYHDFDKKYPRLGANILETPPALFYGIPTATLGLLGLLVLSVVVQPFIGSNVITVSYFAGVAAYFAGLASIVFTTYGTYLKIAEYREANDLDVSFVEFIGHAGNYHQSRTFRVVLYWFAKHNRNNWFFRDD